MKESRTRMNNKQIKPNRRKKENTRSGQKSQNGRNGRGGAAGRGRSYPGRETRPAAKRPAARPQARREEPEREPDPNLLIGRNPVLEALKSGRTIDKITILKDPEGSLKMIAAKARDARIPVHYAERIALDRISGGLNHQGVIANVPSYDYAEVEDILALAAERGEDPFIVILDNIEDPHNLGAIMRSAECAGAHGIIIPSRRSAGITETVVKASAGAVEYIPCAKVTNIAAIVDELKEKGIWIAACDMDGEEYTKADISGPIAIVIGSEGFGISRLVKEKCDLVVSLPLKGKINSLNASNAAAVLMYEVRRQRDERLV
jgi:23S rRNA (guanosine2251-2'-O)-methyltransferase